MATASKVPPLTALFISYHGLLASVAPFSSDPSPPSSGSYSSSSDQIPDPVRVRASMAAQNATRGNAGRPFACARGHQQPRFYPAFF